ncbi:type-F conjugative transfer system secretin TraK [Asticcacaulis sp. BYS171W]|uniref:Type-F conjugative transfer system secretin TraK n=1 Tax=Asticcacaulis aquaticus TaxID=2984212 RepID=A0ABT5HWD5_9CAUL|nr:type-F conjugative transfer system secretin TraK [Asticcacaulis aquaticus]MDC7684407.1 type-F conjugative transfer system secretin TraK [Asticcacaulis aquaticus]
MIRSLLLGGAAAMMMAASAGAETLNVKGDQVLLQVSSSQMSRVHIQGERIATVRTVQGGDGAELLIEKDETTGDVYVGFDGDTSGQTFSAFLTTESGKTVQATFHPVDDTAKTFELKLEGTLSATSPVTLQFKRNGYPETMAAFVKLMFNPDRPGGVVCRQGRAQPTQTSNFRVWTIERCDAEGIAGTVLHFKNISTVPQTLSADGFLVRQVLAVGITDELLSPGEEARVYIVEEAR